MKLPDRVASFVERVSFQRHQELSSFLLFQCKYECFYLFLVLSRFMLYRSKFHLNPIQSPFKPNTNPNQNRLGRGLIRVSKKFEWYLIAFWSFCIVLFL